MENIASVQEQLAGSERPVAKAIHKTENSTSICIGFKKGMVLDEHKANRPTTLLVLNGSISYVEGEKEHRLKQFDQYPIPVGVLHAVEALEDSKILLMMG